jgi:ABC-type Fe3+/spermidine/putrescine transport system ATPase subunit
VNSLQLEGVAKVYGSRKALDGFSLEVGEGERVALLGPSGCGKTTALRLLAGFEAPEAGRVLVGVSVVAERGRIVVPPERRGIGMVFQDLALWPHMTVRGNLEFGLRAQGIPGHEREGRIHRMLARVELLEYADARPGSLSGGQQQRVALARALVLRPRALLMDEPLSSLDEELNLKLRGEILQLQGEFGFALLYVTHDREEAFALAERIVLVARGRALLDGVPHLIRSHLALHGGGSIG